MMMIDGSVLGMTEMTMLKESPFPAGTRLRNRFNHDAVAARCKEEPGEWFRVDDFPIYYASMIKGGKIAQYQPEGSFQATTRKLPVAEGAEGAEAEVKRAVYLRYVGDVHDA